MPGVPALNESAWDHFPHGADIGVHGLGRNAAEAFEQAALATTAIVVEPSLVRLETSVDIACEATSLDDLLVEWLNAVIFEMSSRRMVFGSFAVTIDNHRLIASARGEALDPERHEPAGEPKGAAYTMLRVAPREDGTWDAQCVVDV
jgi:SHS2 domain-containing protein